MHAPALKHRRRLNSTPSLWRARTLLLDQPGSLQKITQPLAKLETNILSIHDHLMDGSGLQDTVMDEFVLSAPGNRAEQELLQAMPDGGGHESHVWPTTALAMADGQTDALSLAARIAGNPTKLPLAVAELLSAKVVPADPERPAPEAGTAVAPSADVLKIPTAWHGPLVFIRPSEPFTPETDGPFCCAWIPHQRSGCWNPSASDGPESLPGLARLKPGPHLPETRPVFV